MKIRYIYLLLLLFIVSCHSPNTPNNGLTKVQLLGWDVRDCVCCGGLMLSFKLDTIQTLDTFLLVDNIVKNDIINQSTVFPLIVKVEWNYSTRTCVNTLVNITRIEK